MRVVTANAAHLRSQFSDRLFKSLRQRQGFSSAVIENGRELSQDGMMLCLPKIEREHTISSSEERLSYASECSVKTEFRMDQELRRQTGRLSRDPGA